MIVRPTFLLSATLAVVGAFDPSPLAGDVVGRPRYSDAHADADAAPRPFQSPITPLRMSSGDGGTDEAERLRAAAERLREEARVAEERLDRPAAPATAEAMKPVEYTALGNSCWDLTYRFANEPESSDDEAKDETKEAPIRKYYDGTIRLKFRADGYTDMLPISGGVEPRNPAQFNKVWGWDKETSAEDELDYLLFSADITLPPPISVTERFYFQARVDREGKNDDVLKLEDGSVTVKRDVVAPGGGWWGIFRGAEGILAQFRAVGEFRCRAVEVPEEP